MIFIVFTDVSADWGSSIIDTKFVDNYGVLKYTQKCSRYAALECSIGVHSALARLSSLEFVIAYLCSCNLVQYWFQIYWQVKDS